MATFWVTPMANGIKDHDKTVQVEAESHRAAAEQVLGGAVMDAAKPAEIEVEVLLAPDGHSTKVNMPKGYRRNPQ